MRKITLRSRDSKNSKQLRMMAKLWVMSRQLETSSKTLTKTISSPTKNVSKHLKIFIDSNSCQEHSVLGKFCALRNMKLLSMSLILRLMTWLCSGMNSILSSINTSMKTNQNLNFSWDQIHYLKLKANKLET